jgi:hypothetical protein
MVCTLTLTGVYLCPRMTLTIIKKNFEVLTLLETWMFKIG